MKTTPRYSRLTIACAALAVWALLGSGRLSAGQAGLVNARIETRSAAAGLEPAVRAALAGGTTAWIGYRVPLARRSGGTISTTDTCCGRCRLEPPAELLVLARLEMGAIVGLKALAVDCDVDAAGMPVIWLNDVKADESVAWLTSLVERPPTGASSQSTGQAALVAVGQHAAPSAVRALIRLAREGQIPRVRSQALFWLGQRASAEALATITGAIADDPDSEVKKKAVFALAQLPKDQGVPKLIDVARTHKDAAVRKQAMFWLGQSNDARALKFFEETLLK